MLLLSSKKKLSLPILHAPLLIDVYLLLVVVLAEVQMEMVDVVGAEVEVEAEAGEAEDKVAEDGDKGNVLAFPQMCMTTFVLRLLAKGVGSKRKSMLLMMMLEEQLVQLPRNQPTRRFLKMQPRVLLVA